MKPEHVGQSLSKILEGLGIREDVEAQAIRKILADRSQGPMREHGFTRTARHGGANGDPTMSPLDALGLDG
jgi:hypothetical protein